MEKNNRGAQKPIIAFLAGDSQPSLMPSNHVVIDRQSCLPAIHQCFICLIMPFLCFNIILKANLTSKNCLFCSNSVSDMIQVNETIHNLCPMYSVISGENIRTICAAAASISTNVHPLSMRYYTFSTIRYSDRSPE